MPLRLIFMGTPEFAVPTLLELVAHGHEIAAVYTRAPKPAGRGMKLQPTPVEQEARRLGIPVLTPTTLKTPEALEEFRAHNADAAVVVAYGMILPQAILDAPPLGCFNLHGSLLPRWRGAAPINRAIMAGDAESGVMVMKMDVGLDTGDVAMAERLPIIGHHDRGRSARCAGAARRRPDGARDGRAGARRAATDASRARTASPTPPRSRRPRRGSTGASRRARCCGTSTACRRFPAPGARSRSTASRRASRSCAASRPRARARRARCSTTSSTIACGDGAIRILELQRAGKAPMKAADFLRGTPLKPPARLG